MKVAQEPVWKSNLEEAMTLDNVSIIKNEISNFLKNKREKAVIDAIRNAITEDEE